MLWWFVKLEKNPHLFLDILNLDFMLLSSMCPRTVSVCIWDKGCGTSVYFLLKKDVVAGGLPTLKFLQKKSSLSPWEQYLHQSLILKFGVYMQSSTARWCRVKNEILIQSLGESIPSKLDTWRQNLMPASFWYLQQHFSDEKWNL